MMVKRSAELWLINVTGKSVVLWLKQMGLNGIGYQAEVVSISESVDIEKQSRI
jgi:hypothetical protein